MGGRVREDKNLKNYRPNKGGDLMVRVGSLFSQLLKHLPRGEFLSIVKKHQGERGSKGFDCRTQLVAMLFSQLAKAESLREICNGLHCCLGKLVHLGLSRAPNKSTLAYANKHRPAAIYEDLFWKTLERFRSTGQLGKRKAKFRFKNKLLSLDATVISLCLSMFPWAEFRRAKGGIKAHVLLDHDDYMPTFVRVTPAKTHEVNIARTLDINPGSILAIDKGFVDYALFGRWTRNGVFFVTRLKTNAAYTVVRHNDLPASQDIIADQLIWLTGPKAADDCPEALRRIVVWDSVNRRKIVLLTNHLDFAASTIAAIYKDRWEIETFFKTLKQNLKIKTFIGTSLNALLIQFWTALIALLLLKWLHHLSKAGWSFSNMATMLRLNLFTYRELRAWLDHPRLTPPIIPVPEQPPLPLSFFGQPNA